jgi:hypothetical protein
MAANYNPPYIPAGTGAGGQQLDVDNTGKGPDTPPVGVPANLLGTMNIPSTGYLVNHEAPEDNIIFRDVPNPLFDSFDVATLADQTIFELLPAVPVFPDTPPLSLNVYVANWSRIINFGGVTDATKDPTSKTLFSDWTLDNWAYAHKWPQVATLDPTYMFFTQDPALFYTQQVISHYEPDTDGILKAIPVPANDIVWKLNGKEVHRGWFMNLSALSETVTRSGTGNAEQAVVVPKNITVEAHNNKGVITKTVKYAAIDSDAASLLGGPNQVDNFSAFYEGAFVADESDGTKGIVFQEDPRYGPRDFYVRFKWNNFGNGKSRRRKFKKSTAKFIVDGQVIETLKGTDVYDRWQPVSDWSNLRHQDAKAYFPDAFEPFSTGGTNNDTLVVKEEYRDKGGAQLGDINVTDWTNGRKSAIFTHEPTSGQSKLFKFSKKPGPFTLFMGTDFRVRMPGQGRVTRFFEKTISFTDAELNIDTPLRPIDLGVFNIDYDHRD